MTTKFGIKKLDTSLYSFTVWRIMRFDVLNRSGVAHQCERQTDRQTDWRTDEQAPAS